MGSQLVRFNAGDTIFKAGDDSRTMYIIRSGKVQVYINKNEQLIPLTELGSGQYIGEMSFLSGVKRSATIIAETPVTANLIPPEILTEQDMGLSSWAVSIARVLVRRLRATTELLGDYIVSKESPDRIPGRRADDLKHFEIVHKDLVKPGRLYLKGQFTESSIEDLKLKIRELKLKKYSPVVLDFSDVFDIDQAGIGFIFNLTKSSELADAKIQIENIQLIRDKVLALKGLQDILTTTQVPMKRVAADEMLIKYGDNESVMYVVKSGSFSISRKTESGKIELAAAEAGDVIGEMSLIKDGPRSADVKALKSSVVYVIDAREFYNNVYNVPRWFIELIQGLVQRLRDTDEMLALISRDSRKKETARKWTAPLGVQLDSTQPGKFILAGVMNLSNFQYLVQLIKLEMKKGTKKVVLDLTRVKQMEKESISALLSIYSKLKARGMEIEIRGPQKNILYLKKQFDIDE